MKKQYSVKFKVGEAQYSITPFIVVEDGDSDAVILGKILHAVTGEIDKATGGGFLSRGGLHDLCIQEA